MTANTEQSARARTCSPGNPPPPRARGHGAPGHAARHFSPCESWPVRRCRHGGGGAGGAQYPRVQGGRGEQARTRGVGRTHNQGRAGAVSPPQARPAGPCRYSRRTPAPDVPPPHPASQSSGPPPPAPDPLDQRPHMLPNRRHDRRLLTQRPPPQRRRRHCRPLPQQHRQVQLTLDAALHADHGQPAVDRQRPHIPVQILRADDVEDDVRPRPVRRLAQLLHEVLLAVVDQNVRAQFRAPRQLLRPTRRDGHPRPHRLGQLNRHRADPARATVDQQRLARPQVGDHEHVRPHRRGHLRQRRRRDQVHPFGHRQQLPGRHGGLLRVTTAREQRAHLVAQGPSRDTGPQGRDAPRAFEPGIRGRTGRRIVEALPLQQIGAVDGARDDVDEDLSLAGHGIGHLGPDKRLGTTRFGNRDRMHGREATPERAC